jgi:hypothetical protein
VTGPEAVSAVRTKALRDCLIGLGAAILGVVMTVGSYMYAASKDEGGSYVITWGLVLFGLVMLGKGAYGFMRHAGLQKKSQA